MEKNERKIYKMYERDMDIITDSLLSLSSNCLNNNLKEKMKKLLQYTDDCDDAILSNRLNLILYKHFDKINNKNYIQNYIDLITRAVNESIENTYYFLNNIEIR
jgi:hypothetical protein